MREYTPRKDGKPRFFGTDKSTIIVDHDGYHEYCKHCRRLLFEYLDGHGASAYSCGCPAITVDHLLSQIFQTIETCQDVESVRRMILAWKLQKDMPRVQ